MRLSKKEKAVVYFAIQREIRQIRKSIETRDKLSKIKKLSPFIDSLIVAGWTEDDEKYLRSALKKLIRS